MVTVLYWIVYVTVLFSDGRIPNLWVHAFIAFYLHPCSDLRSENWVNMLDAEIFRPCCWFKRKKRRLKYLFLSIIYLFIYSFRLLHGSGHSNEKNAGTLQSKEIPASANRLGQSLDTHRQNHSCVTTQLDITYLADRVV